MLDGLDEMQAELRPAAVRALSELASQDRPLVLTCRAREYEDTIATTGTPLARAAVVEIEPVTAAQAAEAIGLVVALSSSHDRPAGRELALGELLGGPAAGDERIDPRLTLAMDRTATFVVAVTFGLVGALPIGFAVGAADGVSAGFMVVVAVVLLGALMAVLGSAWFRFVLARCWLAAHGHLPWRLMRFLDDAYRRGVLRQVGAEYQFRHARLQHHLGGCGRDRGGAG